MSAIAREVPAPEPRSQAPEPQIPDLAVVRGERKTRRFPIPIAMKLDLGTIADTHPIVGDAAQLADRQDGLAIAYNPDRAAWTRPGEGAEQPVDV
jgi:hypothetical protein